jgi:hypothetical protein
MTSPLHVGRLLRYRLIKCFTKMNPSSQGVKIFACIDHSGEAEKVGLRMHPAQPLIFGSGHERMLSKLHSTSPVCN